MDVKNLYINIPIAAGIQCVRKIFEEYPDPKRPDEELLKLLEINLTRNDFTFNRNFYLQIKETAMGKKFAPAYANIFMANWEREAILKCNQKPAFYFRYLDDIWGIWTGSKREFEEILGGCKVFANSRVISAYRRKRNLKDFLVHAKSPSLVKEKTLLLDSQFVRLRFIKNNCNKTILKISQGFSPRSKY